MREILFRGKNLENEWVCGYYWFNKLSDEHFIKIIHHGADYTTIENVVVIPETIGQYTGLIDKNGKKIFEGDILREYSNEIEDWIVSYEYGKFVATYDNVCEDLFEISDLEVIGNIFDKEDDDEI